MTIIVQGYALPTATGYSAPIAYGFTIKGKSVPVTPGMAENVSIENWYAVDFRIKRRRPITPEEFALLREFVRVRDRVRTRYLKDQRELRALNREFAAQLGFRQVDSYQGIRLPYRGDYSGLIPVKRRVGPARNRAAPSATLRRHGEGRHEGAQARDAGRLRHPVRGLAARKTGVR